jgi:hypothetical protein
LVLGFGPSALPTAHKGSTPQKSQGLRARGTQNKNRKVFANKLTKNPKTDFFSIIFITFVGVSRRGGSKSPGTFLAPEEPTNHVKARFFLKGG